ncbi:MAG: hypothetical protein ACKOFJ_07090 [Actinomycetota bacterium]
MNTFTRLLRTVIALVLITSVSVSPSIAAGRTNQTAANTVLNGKGAPTAKVGINGDFYIDVLTFNIYGPKANNRWPSPVSLKGPAGIAGSEGKAGEKGNSLNGARGEQGEKGDKGDPGEKGEKGEKGAKGDIGATGLTGATGPAGLTGATGATGLQGTKGDTGAQGLKGETGLTGAQGLKGDTGLTGAQGLKGDTGAAGAQGLKGDTGATGVQGLKGDNGSTGAQGLKGDTGSTGSQGLKGDTGSTGAQGLKGDKGDTGSTGATGATGPSNVQIVSIPEFTLSTVTPNTSTQSSYFGSLSSGQNYQFSIIIRAKSSNWDGNIGLDLYSSGSGNSLVFNYMTSSIQEFRDGITWNGYQFMIIGTIKVGTGGSSLSVALFDGLATSGSAPVKATGIATITLVGSVTALP